MWFRKPNLHVGIYLYDILKLYNFQFNNLLKHITVSELKYLKPATSS